MLVSQVFNLTYSICTANRPVYHRLEIGLELERVDVGVGDDGEHDLYDEGPRAARAAAPTPEILDLKLGVDLLFKAFRFVLLFRTGTLQQKLLSCIIMHQMPLLS